MGRRTRLITSGLNYRHQVYSQSGKLVYEAVANPKFFGGPRFVSYTYLDAHLVARTQPDPTGGGGTTTTYLHTDGLGTPVAETDSAGTLIANPRSLHEPYGLIFQSPRTQGPGYTGHVYDTLTTLSYMQQRYYDPIAGRFLSVDPVSANPGNGSNFNRYWYANNNPYGNVDPDGRAVVLAPIVAGAVIGGVVGGVAAGYNSYKSTGSISTGAVAAGVGQGALVGAAAVLGAAGLGAMATSAGASAVSVGVAEVGGAAYAGGAATFITGPSADLARGENIRGVGDYGKEAAAAAVGAGASAAVGIAAGALISQTGAQSALITPVKMVVEEAAGMGATNQASKGLEKLDEK